MLRAFFHVNEGKMLFGGIPVGMRVLVPNLQAMAHATDGHFERCAQVQVVKPKPCESIGDLDTLRFPSRSEHRLKWTVAVIHDGAHADVHVKFKSGVTSQYPAHH